MNDTITDLNLVKKNIHSKVKSLENLKIKNDNLKFFNRINNM